MTEAEALVRSGFEALNEGDLERLIELCSPEVEFLPLGAVRVEGRSYRGHGGLREWHREREATWSLRYRLDEVVPLGGRVLVHGALHSRGASSGVELDTRASWVVELREGLVVRIEAFLDRAEAERAARAS